MPSLRLASDIFACLPWLAILAAVPMRSDVSVFNEGGTAVVGAVDELIQVGLERALFDWSLAAKGTVRETSTRVLLHLWRGLLFPLARGVVCIQVVSFHLLSALALDGAERTSVDVRSEFRVVLGGPAAFVRTRLWPVVAVLVVHVHRVQSDPVVAAFVRARRGQLRHQVVDHVIGPPRDSALTERALRREQRARVADKLVAAVALDGTAQDFAAHATRELVEHGAGELFHALLVCG